MTPRRIQLSRAKGWRKPEGAIVVSRPSKWGNPFVVGKTTPNNWTFGAGIEVRDAAHAVELYRELLAVSPQRCAEIREQLAGHDLACWCWLTDPCHADVLLEIANTPAPSGRTTP